MKIVVITGNIGCGKTTAAHHMLKLMAAEPGGCSYFSYDAAVATAYQDPAIQAALKAITGTSVKSEVSDVVFKRKDLLAQVQSIFIERMDAEMRRIVAVGTEYVLMDIPLWFENSMSDRHPCDTLITVAADEATQIERVRARNGWSVEKILSVMGSQWTQAEKIACSDFTISNTGTLDRLYQQVEHYFNHIKDTP